MVEMMVQVSITALFAWQMQMQQVFIVNGRWRDQSCTSSVLHVYTLATFLSALYSHYSQLQLVIPSLTGLSTDFGALAPLIDDELTEWSHLCS